MCSAHACMIMHVDSNHGSPVLEEGLGVGSSGATGAAGGAGSSRALPPVALTFSPLSSDSESLVNQLDHEAMTMPCMSSI